MLTSISSFNSTLTKSSRNIIILPPTNITATNITASSVTINFTPPSGTITSYIATTNDGAQGSGTTSPITISGLANNTTYTVTIVSYNLTYYSTASTSVSFTTLIPYTSGLKWWRYAGYANDNVTYTDTATLQALSGKTSSGSGSVDFTNIGTATQENQPVNGAEQYTVLWLGYFFTGNNSGTFTFYTTSDDLSYLWIGAVALSGYTTGNCVVNNGGAHGMNQRSGTISLSANTYYPIRILFGEAGGGDNIYVWFNLPGSSTNIYNGTGYYYTLGGGGTFSLVTTNTGIPIQPTVISITQTENTITINFNQPTKATTGSTYSLFYGATIYGTATYPSTSITATNLQPNTLYNFNLTVTNTYGTSVVTSTINGLTLPVNPVYELLTVSSTTALINIVNFGPSASVTNTIYVTPSSGITITNSGSVYTINGLQQNTNYVVGSQTNNAAGYANNGLGQVTNISPLITVASGANLSAISAFGQYICLGCYGNGIYVSTNYGATFTKIVTEANASQSAISVSGQYMYVACNNIGRLYYSSNYGTSFTSVTIGSNISGISCSNLGNIVYACDLTNGGIYYSINYGVTWSAIVLVGANITAIKSNLMGTIAYMTSTSTGKAYAYNFYSNSVTVYSPGGSSNVSGIAISSNGQYIYVCNNGGYCYVSNNAGSSFAQISSTYLPSSSYAGILCDSTGQYVYVHNSTTNLYYSTNYGATFSSITLLNNSTLISLNSNGSYMGISSGSGVYISTNGFLFNTTTAPSLPLIDSSFSFPLVSNNSYTYYINSGFTKSAGYNYTTIPGWSINYSNGAVAVANGSNAFFTAAMPSGTSQAFVYQISGTYSTQPYCLLSQNAYFSASGNYFLNFSTIPRTTTDPSYISLTAMIAGYSTSTTLLNSTSSWKNTAMPFTVMSSGNYNALFYFATPSAYVNTAIGSSISITNVGISQAFLPPTNLLITSTASTSATISFTAATTAGVLATSYTSTIGSGSGTATAYTVTGLTANSNNNVGIIANYPAGFYGTGNGFAGSSGPSSIITIFTVPSAPTLTFVSATINSVTISLDNSGAGIITGYTVTTVPNSGGITSSGPSSAYVIANLLSNTVYNINVFSSNSSGIGPAGTITVATLPNPPTNLTGTTVSDTYISLSFINPTGSAPITQYAVTSNPDNITITGTTSPLLVTGLNASTSYTFTATATNSSGTSMPSTESSPAITNSTPSSPTNLTVVSTASSSITISFTPPIGFITGYIASTSNGYQGTSKSSPIIITGLGAATTYTISIVSVNYNGYSTASSTISATTSGLTTPLSLTNFQTSDASGTVAVNSDQYMVYAFKTTGITYTINYNFSQNTIVNILAVGGGGGGGSFGAGGAGSGGVSITSVTLPSGSNSFTVVVGAGGIGAATNSGNGGQGENTTISFNANSSLNIISGGGSGGCSKTTPSYTQYGSGGGGGASAGQCAPTNANTNGGKVYANNGAANSGNTAGGGGGAGTAGGIPSSGGNVQAGGDGIICSLVGISTFSPSGVAYGTYYWGGGGGGSSAGQVGGNGGKGGGGGGGQEGSNAVGTGGTGGISLGGNATSGSDTYVGAGGVNTGGGGGSNWISAPGGNGGSGIVVISYSGGSGTSAPTNTGILLQPALISTSTTTSSISVNFTAPVGAAAGTTYALVYGVTTYGTASYPATTINATGLTSNTSYTMNLTAANAYGTSIPTLLIKAVTVIASPTINSTSSITTTSAIMNFTAPANVNAGITYAAISSGVTYGTASYPAITITDASLNPNTTYLFSMTASNVNSTSTASNTVSITTLPPPPTNLVSTVICDTIISVAFTPSSGTAAISNYAITSSPGAIIVNGTSSPLIITGLNANTSYTFTATATNITGTSVRSIASTAVTTNRVPNPPTNLILVSTTPTSAIISFTAPLGTILYYIVTVNSLTYYSLGSPITIPGLSVNTNYSATIQAVNANGTSVASNSISFTTSTVTVGSVLNAPTIGIASSITTTSAIINYTAPTGATTGTTYSAYVGSIPYGASVYPATSIYINGLIPNTAYTFTVFANNQYGSSASSEILNLATFPLPPTALTLVNQTATTAYVGFTGITGNATLVNYKATDASGIYTGTNTVSPIIVSGLNSGTTYSFSLTSTNSITTTVISTFNPTTITGILLWLDAKDPYNNGTQPSNGALVNTWYDKSGGGRNGTSSSGVTYSTTGFNNLPGFSITNLFAQSNFFTGSISITSTTMTIFAVALMSSSSTGAGRVIGFSNGNGVNDYNNAGFMGFLRQSGTGFGPYRSGAYVNNNPPSYSTPYLWECWYDGATEYATVQIGNSTTIGSTGSSGNFAITYYCIGNNPNTADGGGPMTGYISEIVVYNTCLSATDRQKMEGYLSWKWGIQTNLPTSHPYYSVSPTSPTVTTVTETSAPSSSLIVTTLLSAPTILSVSSITSTTALFSFTPPTGSTTGTTYTAIAGGNTYGTAIYPSTFILASGLSSNTSYSFNIKAINSAGTSLASNAQSVLTLPSPPTNITIGIASDTVLNVWFDKVLGTGTITNYTVTSSPGNYTYSGTSIPIAATGLLPNTAYTFSMTSTNSQGTSIPSNIVGPATTFTVPNIPAGVYVSGATPATISISFAPPIGTVVSYIAKTTTGLYGYSTSIPIIIGGLAANTTYTISVAAVGPLGTSSYSNTVTAKTTTTTNVSSISTFDPTTISGLFLWLDANTNVLTTGSNVYQWNDRSSSGYNFVQSSSSSQPITGTNYNSLQLLNFTSSKYMQNTTMTFPAPPYTIISVGYTTVGGYGRLIAGVPDAYLFFGSGSGVTQFATFVGRGGWNDVSTDVPGTSVSSMCLMEMTNSGTSNGLIPYVNATALTEKNGTASACTGLYLGTSGGGGQPWSGYVGEILMYNSVLTTNQRQSIEGYLAWKWGLQASLPTSHPYFSGTLLSPTISTFSSITTNSAIINITPPSGASSGTIYNAIVGSVSYGTSSYPSTSIFVGGLSSNTAYTFALTTVNNFGTSSASSTASVTTLPSAPASLTILSVSTNTVTLSFIPSSGSVSVTYSSSVGTGSGTPSSYIISGLTSTTAYSISIIATNVTGSSTSSVIAITTATASPTNLSANSITANSAIITFTAPVGVTNGSFFTLYAGGQLIGSINYPNSSFNLTGLNSNTIYPFTITATNSNGTSIASNILYVTTLPSIPTNITVISATTSTIIISFTDTTGNASIGYSLTSGIGYGNSSGYTLPNLNTNSSYTFAIIATNSSGSATSTPITVFTPLPPPTGLSASSVTINSVIVSFTPPTGAANWNTYTISSGGISYGTASYPATTINVTGLTSNTIYSFTITAANYTAISTASTSLSVTTLPNPPTNINASVVSDTVAIVTFTASTGPATIINYTVTSSPGNKTSTGTSSPISINGLDTNTPYTFTITATNSQGTSISSATSSPITISPTNGSVITSASFNIPTTSGQIVIGSIIGTQTSFNITRTGGTQGTFAAKGQTGTSYTDPTVLTNNTQYTYTITPVKDGYNGQTFTTITNPNNSSTPGSIYTLATVSGLNLTYSGASSSVNSVGITWTNNGYTTLYLANTTKSGANYTAVGTSYNSTTNGSSDTGLTVNTQYTYRFITQNGDGYYVANSNCQTIVNTCTWAICNTPTSSGTTSSGTTLACTGTFSGVYITYSGGSGSPSSGTTIVGTNSISQAYTGMSIVSPYIFTCYPVNALNYQSSNSVNVTVVNPFDGLTSATAAPSATFLASQGVTTNGTYWITLPTVGATQIYCILDRAVDGGGWMMAMKATRGTTFQYTANYWTTNNTLNPANTNRNDGDAKYNTMNYSTSTDLLALWPDITTVGGSLNLTSYGCWSWLQNKFTSSGTPYVGTGENPSTTTVSGITTSMTLIDWFSKISSVRYFIQDAITWLGWGTGTTFSSQTDVRFYGFNYMSNTTPRTRWGFGWNENGGGLFPAGNMGSDDVMGGIGMANNSYSAGDIINCCQNKTGINRTARVEVYIRDSSSAPSAPTIGTASKSGSTVTVPFTSVTGATYYTAFSNTGGFYGSSATSPVTITGVTAGTYTFTVKASNASGTSLASGASGSVTV